jgi:insulysin
VILAVFKYLNLLRASSFPVWNQREIVSIDATRFRFTEKTRPDDYAVYLAEHMAWPVPEDLIVAAPQLTQPWDSAGEDEKIMRRMLDGLTVHNGRAVLMARGEEHERVNGAKDWKNEPVYGTEYNVVRMDDAFVKEASVSGHSFAGL